jgi:three-Cys-motif partner protein
VFVESSAAKAAQLNALKAKHPKLAGQIEVVQSDANEYLLSRSSENWLKSGRRAVVFVDPFGMQVDWTTIEGLAKTSAVDLWLLYPVSAINRLLSQHGVKFDSWKVRLDRVFGGGEWVDAFYRTAKTANLFDNTTSGLKQKVVDIPGLTNYMVAKLESVFAQAVKTPLVLRAHNETPLFALCFAAANPKGAPIACRIAKHILEQ